MALSEWRRLTPWEAVLRAAERSTAAPSGFVLTFGEYCAPFLLPLPLKSAAPSLFSHLSDMYIDVFHRLDAPLRLGWPALRNLELPR